MPKVTNTRKQKAAELYKMAQQGPAIFPMLFGSQENPNVITKDEFEEHYARWAKSWILPALEELVPELKDLKDAREAARLKPLEYKAL